MPIYQYQDPGTGELKDVFQNINDEHVYYQDGVKWNRIWSYTFSASSSSSRIDPFDVNAFVRKTNETKGTIGDVLDLSKELGERRKQIAGEDPVKKQWTEEYSKKRNGRKPSIENS